VDVDISTYQKRSKNKNPCQRNETAKILHGTRGRGQILFNSRHIVIVWVAATMEGMDKTDVITMDSTNIVNMLSMGSISGVSKAISLLVMDW
jgi:hypothetical protein